MATQTPNYSFDLPAVGADGDVWGGFLNGNWASLDTLLKSIQDAVLPIGTVIMWANDGANEGNIPTGFVICDGTQHPRSDGQGNITTPNLRSRFIVGGTGDGTGDYQNNTTGEGDASGAVVSVAAHTLTEAEIPSHDHGSGSLAGASHSHSAGSLTGENHSHAGVIQSNSHTGQGAEIVGSGTTFEPGETGTVIGGAPDVTGNTGSSSVGISGNTANAGGGGAHAHPGSTVDVSNADLDPAWYAVIYIMKV